MVEIDGEPIDPEAPREVRFEGDRVAGRVGANRFTGSFTLDGDTLQRDPSPRHAWQGRPS